MKYIPSLEEKERRNRIMLSVYAYAYEFEHESLVSDHVFDKLAFSINVEVNTGDSLFDNFFKTEFSPSTGMWIRYHPDLDGIVNIYRRMTANKKKGQI